MLNKYNYTINLNKICAMYMDSLLGKSEFHSL
jgi:hypothetical protein